MSAESVQEIAKLPYSTAECDEGPEITHRPGEVIVRYDAETQTGKTWTTLRFIGAVALKVTPGPSVSEWAVQAYSRVSIVNESLWLALLQSHAAGDGTLPTDLQHFVIFFDHFGAVEIVSRSWQLVK